MTRKHGTNLKQKAVKGFLMVLMVVYYVLMMMKPAMAAEEDQGNWKLEIQQANKPENRIVGEAFAPKGIVISNKKIQNIFIAVYDASGKEMVSCLRSNLGIKEYDISQMKLDLTKLPVGKNYTYVVAVRDEAGKKNLVKTTFHVEEKSTLHVDGFGYLNTVGTGHGFKIAGTLVSNYTIQTCYAAIYDQNDRVLVDKVVEPKGKSFDLVNMTLPSGDLPAGTYTYRLAARDEAERKMLACETLYIVVEDPYTEKMNAFINSNQWKHGAEWEGSKRPTISQYGGSGCCAYAADFVKYVFGSDNARGGSAFTNPSEIRSGDVIYVSGKDHWFVVLERNGNQLTTAEGNWGGKVVISKTAYTVNQNTLMRDGKKFRTFEKGYHFQ